MEIEKSHWFITLEVGVWGWRTGTTVPAFAFCKSSHFLSTSVSRSCARTDFHIQEVLVSHLYSYNWKWLVCSPDIVLSISSKKCVKWSLWPHFVRGMTGCSEANSWSCGLGPRRCMQVDCSGNCETWKEPWCSVRSLWKVFWRRQRQNLSEIAHEVYLSATLCCTGNQVNSTAA